MSRDHRLSWLRADGFRNLQKAEVNFSAGSTILVGPNGAGKTALLEALHFCIRGRSFRTNQSSDLLDHAGSSFLLRLGVDTPEGVEHQLGVQRERKKKQVVRWDGSDEKGFGRLSALFPLQVIEPTISELVFGAPALRRRWWDWGTFHVEHSYLRQWRSYMRLLQQRNALLKQESTKTNAAGELSLLDTYTAQLIEAAELVKESRQRFVELWLPCFERKLAELLSRIGNKTQAAASPFGSSKSMTIQDLLSEARGRELKSGVTAYGPHKADLVLTMDGKPLKDVASRGQGKIVSLAMVLAQAEVIAANGGGRSVFLLDDVFAELDPENLDRLLDGIFDSGGQVLMTAPSEAAVPDRLREERFVEAAVFHVEHGKISKETS